jgi:4-amino-4-deoxy-L-arabinose transferase-like glycosyltransferase
MAREMQATAEQQSEHGTARTRQPWRHWLRAHWRLLACGAALTLLALGLRVWGAGWSLPYVDHPDEPAVMRVLLRIVQGDPNPDHFFYPSLVLYLQALVLALHLWLGGLVGLYPAGFELPRSTHFYTTIPAAFVWARVFTALLSTGTVVALAAWGARFFGARAALIGAALLACSPWAIEHAHYVTVDAPAAFFGLLALLAALSVAQRGDWRSYLLAGVLFGLATGAKYQNVLLCVSLGLAHLACWRSAALTQAARLAAAGLLGALVFLLTSPYLLLDFAGFMRDMETLFGSYAAAKGDVGRAWPFDAYLRFHWREALGPLPFVLAGVGAVVLARRRPALALVWLSFPLLLIGLLLRMETHFYRNLLPAQAPLLLLAGVGAVALWDALAARWRARWSARLLPGLAVAGLLLLLLPTLIPGVQASERRSWPDARVVAQEWVREHYPALRVAGELSHPLRWQGVAQTTYIHFVPVHDAAWYRQQGYGLLLTNAGRRGKDAWSDAYLPLLEAGEVVYSVGGRTSRYLGPRMDVIDIGLTPARVPDYSEPMQLGPLRLLSVQYGRLYRDNAGSELRPGEPLRPGDILAVTAFWLADEPPPPADYTSFLHLRNAQGDTVTQRDAPLWQGLFPPEHWPPGRLVTESLDMALPEGLPPGDYRLVLGLYSPTQQTRFAALVAGERMPDDEIDLGRVVVVPRD